MKSRIKHIRIDQIIHAIANLRQGDYLFLDIDDTLLFEGFSSEMRMPIEKGDYVATEKTLAQLIAILRKSGIHVIGLTARPNRFKETTEQQLKKAGIELEDILYAPSKRSETNTHIVQKGKVLKKYIADLPTLTKPKPKRILVIDDTYAQLLDIEKEMEEVGIPMLLFHYQPKLHQAINNKKLIPFPETLDHFTEITVLEGKKHAYIIRNPKTQQQFILKYDIDTDTAKLDIINDAIYAALDQPVPELHVYNRISENLAKKLNLKSSHGLFQVSEYITNEQDNINTLPGLSQFISYYLFNDDGSKKNLSCLTKDELKKLADYVLAKSAAIEKVIWEVTKKIDLAEDLRDEYLEMMAEGLDKLANSFCNKDRSLARSLRLADEETAAGILSFFNINNEPCILVSERAEEKTWGILGGRSHRIDKNMAKTALRKVAEESNGLLCYQFPELIKSPSHDMVIEDDNGNRFTYRMYMMPSKIIDINELKDKRHTAHCFIPLKLLFEAIEKNKTILCNGQETIKITLTDKEIMLLPQFYRMLRQSSVRENLYRLLQGKNMMNQHTQGDARFPINQSIHYSHHPLESVEEQKHHINDVVLNHLLIMKDLKKQNHEHNNMFERIQYYFYQKYDMSMKKDRVDDQELVTAMLNKNEAMIKRILLTYPKMKKYTLNGLSPPLTAIEFIFEQAENFSNTLLSDCFGKKWWQKCVVKYPIYDCIKDANRITLFLDRIHPDETFAFILRHQDVFKKVNNISIIYNIIKSNLDEEDYCRLNEIYDKEQLNHLLFFAVAQQDNRMLCKFLKISGINPNQLFSNDDGSEKLSPLMMAIIKENTEIVRALLNFRGIDLTLKSSTGKSVFSYAVISNNIEINNMLKIVDIFNKNPFITFSSIDSNKQPENTNTVQRNKSFTIN